MCERNIQPEIEEYCTEYDGMFQIPGFEASDEIELDPEVRIIFIAENS